MMEREESSQATFILALSTRDLGLTMVSLASSVGGGLTLMLYTGLLLGIVLVVQCLITTYYCRVTM